MTASGEEDKEKRSEDRIVVLGRISGTFGVKGWVRIHSYTDPPENIFEYDDWLMSRAGEWGAVEVVDGRMTDKGVLAKLAGMETPEEARLYVGSEIGVPRGQLPPAEPGEYYWSDLEGLEVLGSDGKVLGKVDHFRSTPAGDVVVIRGKREHWVPFVKERIVKVDLAAGQITLDWAEDW
jgi:16S rRNA processing protein RimM